MESMKKIVVGILVFWSILMTLPEQCGFAQTVLPGLHSADPAFRDNEIIVKIRDELPSLSRGLMINSLKTESRNLNSLNEQFGVKQVEQVFRSRTGRTLQQDSPLSNVLLLTLRKDVDEKTAVRAYSSLDEVEYAELNYWYYIFATPNDPFISSQYALQSPSSSQGIDAINGWTIEQGNDSVIIAIVDTGIDYNHEDLAGKVIKGYDFVNEDFDPQDDNGHGTHVAGIAGAIVNNGRGIAGVCPGCSLLAVKVVTADGAGANSWIANGIANAVSLGARVINMSLGGLDNSSTISLAVRQASQKGVLVVAASGNDGSSAPLYPAALPEVIAVGATDRYGEWASFSNYGNHVELTAPGQTIYSTLRGNSYEAWSGTSMACPHVAGVAGLLLSRSPALTNAQVRQVLTMTAEDLGDSGRDRYFGYGRINTVAALNQIPDDGGNYPSPNPNPEPYPTPSPGGTGICGRGLGGIFAMAIIGLGWVNITRRKE